MRQLIARVVLVSILVVLAGRAPAIDLFGDRVQIHGSVEEQLRMLSPDWKDTPNLSAWKTLIGLEGEIRLLDSGFGPLDDLSAFARLEVSYDCVWTHACGLLRSADAYGDRTGRAPSYYTNGRRGGYVGDVLVETPTPYHPGGTDHLIDIHDTPPFEILARNVSFNQAFAPLLGDRFAVHQLAVTTAHGDSSGADAIVLNWRPKDRIQALASLNSVDNTTAPIGGLPMRPSIFGSRYGAGTVAGGLYTPSPGLRELLQKGPDLSRFDQNFRQSELAWNLGANQRDEWFLREAYLDASLFEGRLSLRLGKQTIIWGKTELFRNQDQFNPVDLAVSTLPSLEESRIPLWALRAIYSFYDVGPLQDVRLEFVWDLDDFEPTDLGRCGEPYSPLPVCSKSSQLYTHGALGAGLAGERRPPNWWQSWQGHEVGARLEFRWERFSFAISDFWHYEDSAHPRVFQRFERRVDPSSGRPLNSTAADGDRCITGNESACLQPGNRGPGNAADYATQNRQLFDVICRSSVGFFPALDPNSCALTITNSQAATPLGASVANAVSAAIGGSFFGAVVIGALSGLPPAAVTPFLRQLNNTDPNVAAFPGVAAIGNGLDNSLTPEQRALFGCGPFYGTSCDNQGVDLFNAEASVVFQAWPAVLQPAPVGTRFVNGQTVVLPGARNIFDPAWDPGVDGCPAPTARLLAAGVPAGKAAACAGVTQNLLDATRPFGGGVGFLSELDAASSNALAFIVALDLGTPNPNFPNCSLNNPLQCPSVQDFLSVTGTTRPDLRAGGNGRFGRRDFAWAGAGELVLEYEKVNTLGFAMDFPEERSGTNWGVEFTWTPNKSFVSSETLDRLDKSDRLALTVSVDRPTFVHFLNENKTFFFNMQWFLEYLPGYVGGRSNQRGFEVNGPWTALGTFTVSTSYFQDRLQPSFTVVYDVQSASGAFVAQNVFRFTANLSLTFGINNFFGRPQGWFNSLALGAFGESNQTWQRERFDRLNAVRERDEAFMRLRYTF